MAKTREKDKDDRPSWEKLKWRKPDELTCLILEDGIQELQSRFHLDRIFSQILNLDVIKNSGESRTVGGQLFSYKEGTQFLAYECWDCNNIKIGPPMINKKEVWQQNYNLHCVDCNNIIGEQRPIYQISQETQDNSQQFSDISLDLLIFADMRY